MSGKEQFSIDTNTEYLRNRNKLKQSLVLPQINVVNNRIIQTQRPKTKVDNNDKTEQLKPLVWYPIQGDTFQGQGFYAVYGGGRWIAGGAGQNKMITSVDGITWTSCTGDLLTNETRKIAYDGGGRWVAVGNSSIGKSITTSTDGINWTFITGSDFGLISLQTRSGFDIKYAAGIWVAVGSGPNGSVLYSTNGTVWNSAISGGFSGSNGIGYSVDYSTEQGRWIAVGYGSNANMITSTDGMNWSDVSFSYAGNFVSYSGGKWLTGFTDANLTLESSSDGTNWVPSSGSFSNQGGSSTYYISYGNGRWIASGYSGCCPTEKSMIISTDGTNWESVSGSQFDEYSYAVAYGGGRWVAVGYGSDGNNILSSTTSSGDVWTTVLGTQFTVEGYSISYGNGIWIAVGSGGNEVLYAYN